MREIKRVTREQLEGNFMLSHIKATRPLYAITLPGQGTPMHIEKIGEPGDKAKCPLVEITTTVARRHSHLHLDYVGFAWVAE